MMTQGGNTATLTKQLNTAFHRYPTVFQKPVETHEEINISISFVGKTFDVFYHQFLDIF